MTTQPPITARRRIPARFRENLTRDSRNGEQRTLPMSHHKFALSLVDVEEVTEITTSCLTNILYQCQGVGEKCEWPIFEK